MEVDGKTPLRIGHLPTLYHTSFLLMATDLLKKNDVEAEWTLFASGPDVVNAMAAARLDIGYVGLPPAIIGIDKGIRLVCIAGGHIEGTLMVAGEDVKRVDQCRSTGEFLSQFSGTAIGCPPRGSIHDVIITELFKEHRIEDVCVKNYAWADFLPEAIIEAEISAAAGTPALAVAASRFYEQRTIMPPDRLWPFNPSYGILALRNNLAHRKDEFKRFLVAHELACEMIRRNPRRCAQIVAHTVQVVDAAFVEEAYRISPKYCASLPPKYIASTMKFVNVLNELGYISKRPTTNDIFDTSLIDEVHAGPSHYELQTDSQ